MSQRYPIQLKVLSDISGQKPHVVALENLLIIHEHYKMGWTHTCLNYVIYFQCPLLIFWHIVKFLKLVEPVVEKTCTDTFIPFIVCGYYLIHHLIDIE